MKKRQFLATISCAILVCSSMTLVAQAASGADKDFAKDAIEGGKAEVQFGQLARQKSNSDDVKHFGEKMMTDHGKMNRDMAAIAESLGVKPPTGTPMEAKATETNLKMKSGESFDKAYIEDMVRDHRKDLADFKKEAATTSNPELKKAAEHGITVISEHLRMAEKLAQDHNVDVASR